MKTVLSREQARSIVLRAQLLPAVHKPVKSPEAMALEALKHLGYVQIDTIAVVERAHHHTFWARDGRYTPAVLDALQRQGSIFEYWTHAMAYVPMQDYRFYLPRMQNFHNAKNTWFLAREKNSRHLINQVLRRIREEGPLGAKDFEDDRSGKREGWWDWKPAKDALELLFWKGQLMVKHRDKFQKIYDLPERVIPPGTDTTYPTQEETALFIARSALRALGICSSADIHRFLLPESRRDSEMRPCTAAAVDAAIKELTAAGEAVTVQIEHDKTEYFVLPDNLKKNRPEPEAAVHILSPFDSVVIKRERLKRLFGFDYTIECYLPASKRKYGYFVLPLLYGTAFAGRMDAAANRKEGTLHVHSIHFEQPWDGYGSFYPAFARSLKEFALFNGCRKVSISGGSKQTRAVKAALKEVL